MNIREIMNIINENSSPLGNLHDVHAVLKRQFWNKIEDGLEGNMETWEHMDDPSIGQYDLYFSPTGEMTKINFIYPQSKIMNRDFKSFQEFAKHVDDITEEPIDHVAMMKGGAMLSGIADQLRKNQK